MDVAFQTVSHQSAAFGQIDLRVAVTGPADGPLILCVHGWPEIWHSWRFQMAHFAAQGFRVAAMNVRGYPGSSKPEPVAAYTLTELAGDAAAVIQALSPDAPAILFGHDWGGPIVHNTARLHPELVRAVAGMSVPYIPTTEGDPMELWNLVYADKFFYMKYFQEPGEAEAAFATDLDAALRKTYFAASADSPDLWSKDHPSDHAFLDGLVDPDPCPAWMNPEALAPTLAEFHQGLAEGGLHGLFNRYRAQGLDGEQIPGKGEPLLPMPVCFIGGADDIVRTFVPGMDIFDRASEACTDFRGLTIVDNAGHWVQQEAPEATNAALQTFIDSL